MADRHNAIWQGGSEAEEIGAKTPPIISPPPVLTPADPEPPTHSSDYEDPHLEDLSPWVRESPPWLASAAVHMLLLILFGLLISTSHVQSGVVLDAAYSEDEGEQLEDDSWDLAVDTEEFDVETITPDTLPQVEDPFAAPQIAVPLTNAPFTTPTSDATTIGLALTGREAGMKEALLKAYGGTAATESAVALGLRWLASKQRTNGLWSLQGPYSDGAVEENQAAATAMALLAFQGAGYTHQSEPTHSFTSVVRHGWRALLKEMDDDGNFFHKGPYTHALYTQAQATIALCELYAMTRDPEYRDAAQRAVDYCVRIQSPKGGWRYQPRLDSDTSVTGWFVMALQSARMAGLEVPSQTLDAVSRYLDTVARHNGSRYAYVVREDYRLSLTPEGLLCRQYLGWDRDDPRLVDGVEYLLENLPTYERGKQNVYYWYYATQVCHHMEGSYWRRWNEVMRELLPEHQVTTGRERGSWDPTGDRWGAAGGRLYVTCLSIYALEVYYRHLPIYQHDFFGAGY